MSHDKKSPGNPGQGIPVIAPAVSSRSLDDIIKDLAGAASTALVYAKKSNGAEQRDDEAVVFLRNLLKEVRAMFPELFNLPSPPPSQLGNLSAPTAAAINAAFACLNGKFSTFVILCANNHEKASCGFHGDSADVLALLDAGISYTLCRQSNHQSHDKN